MEEKKYTVYQITAPDGMLYFGLCSTDIRHKFSPLLFTQTVLGKYLDEYDWDSFTKEIIGEGLTKEEAQKLLFENAQKAREEGRLLNKRISVGIGVNSSRRTEYQRRWRNSHREQFNAYMRKQYQANKEKWNQRHKDYLIRKKEEKENINK